MTVHNFNEYRAREVVAVLEEMLQHAKAGRLPGIAFVTEIEGRELVGVTGVYKADPKRALRTIDNVRRKLRATRPKFG